MDGMWGRPEGAEYISLLCSDHDLGTVVPYASGPDLGKKIPLA